MREYKDSLIRALFKKPEKALKLYSDITGKTYPEETIVEMKSPEDILLDKLRNDIAFIIDGKLIVIMEHQSTLSRNIPLRMLQYVLIFFEIYFKLGAALYKEKRVMLPKPEFYMLYNGKSMYPPRDIMRLSESFMGTRPGEESPLELIVNVVNINYTPDSELLNKNKDLREYALFVEKVRKRQKQGLEFKEAVRQTVKECLAEGILTELLKEHEGEVERMFSLIYDEELARKYAREEGWEDGLEKGMERGLEKGREEGLEEGLEKGIELSAKVIQALKENMSVSDIADRYKISVYKVEELRSLI